MESQFFATNAEDHNMVIIIFFLMMYFFIYVHMNEKLLSTMARSPGSGGTVVGCSTEAVVALNPGFPWAFAGCSWGRGDSARSTDPLA